MYNTRYHWYYNPASGLKQVTSTEASVCAKTQRTIINKTNSFLSAVKINIKYNEVSDFKNTSGF